MTSHHGGARATESLRNRLIASGQETAQARDDIQALARRLRDAEEAIHRDRERMAGMQVDIDGLGLALGNAVSLVKKLHGQVVTLEDRLDAMEQRLPGPEPAGWLTRLAATLKSGAAPASDTPLPSARVVPRG